MHTLRLLVVFEFFGMVINLFFELVLLLLLASSLVPKFLFKFLNKEKS